MIGFALRATAAIVLTSAVSAAAADEASCQITFRVGSSDVFSAIMVYPDYSSALGEFQGEGSAVECTPIDELIIETNDDDASRILSIQSSVDLLDGPLDILTCTWLPVGRFPVAGDFDLSNQTGFVFPSYVYSPGVYISNIDCTGTIETTTTTTTTTTFTTTTTTTLETTTTSTTSEPPVVCGDYDGNGTVTIADALSVLRTSVGLAECEPCVCDADGNGSNSISDALRTLRLAVGQDVTTSCPECA